MTPAEQVAAKKGRICRTLEEIRAAGAAAAAAMPDMTDAEMQKVLGLLAPYRDRLIKPMAAGGRRSA